jgi:hypothetical protein
MHLTKLFWIATRTVAVGCVGWVYAYGTPAVDAKCANACDIKYDTSGRPYSASCVVDGIDQQMDCSISGTGTNVHCQFNAPLCSS